MFEAMSAHTPQADKQQGSNTTEHRRLEDSLISKMRNLKQNWLKTKCIGWEKMESSYRIQLANLGATVGVQWTQIY